MYSGNDGDYLGGYAGGSRGRWRRARRTMRGDALGSLLSEGLAHLGVSKDAQRSAVSGTLAAAGATVGIPPSITYGVATGLQNVKWGGAGTPAILTPGTPAYTEVTGGIPSLTGAYATGGNTIGGLLNKYFSPEGVAAREAQMGVGGGLPGWAIPVGLSAVALYFFTKKRS